MLKELIQQAKNKEAELATFDAKNETGESHYWYLRYELSELHIKIADIYLSRKLYSYAVKYYFKAYELTCNENAKNRLNIELKLPELETIISLDLSDLSGEKLFYCGLQAQAGLGMPVNYHLALHYYQAALEKKYIPAYYAIGKLFHNGVGCRKDIKTAFDMYCIGAEQKYPFAQINLGQIFVDLFNDREKAHLHFQQAAAEGSAAGQYNCGARCYKEDDDMAIDWLLRAAMQGYGYANQVLILYLQQRSASKVPCNKDIILKIIHFYRDIIQKYDSKLAKKYLDEVYSLDLIAPSPEFAQAYRVEACKYQIMFAVNMLEKCAEANPANENVSYQCAVACAWHLDWHDVSKLTQLYNETPVALIKKIICDKLFDHVTREIVLDKLLTNQTIILDANQKNEIEYYLGDYYYDQFRAWVTSFDNESKIPEDEAKAKIDIALGHLMKVAPDSAFYRDAADLITLIRSSLLGESYQELCVVFFKQHNLPHPVEVASEELLRRKKVV